MGMEVEIKLKLDGVAEMRRRLAELGFKRHGARTLEINWLFDDKHQTLRRSKRLLRLRKSGKRWILTAKGRAEAGKKHKSRPENQTEVTNGDECREILASIGYTPQFVYERFRSTLIPGNGGSGEAVIDETPAGVYLELEGPPRWIDETAKRLGYSHRDYILASYAEIFRDYVRRHRLKARNFTFAEMGSAPPAGSRRSK